MERYFQDMLYLSGCAVHNRRAVLSEKMDFERIIKESYGQSVLLWVLSAIVTAENPELCPQVDEYRKILFIETSKNAVRRNGVRKLIEHLEGAGLNPVVIKGETLALLYPQPLLRMSVDTDLFFSAEEQCIAAYKLVTGEKEIRRKENGKDYCVKCKDAGRVELHFRLIGEELEQIGIGEEDLIKDSLKRIKTSNDFSLTAFSEINALEYIFCHLISHFLFARCDLKQIIDFNMYISENKAFISSEELYNFLERIGKKTFFDTLQGVGIEYLGFSADKLFVTKYSKESVKMLTEDCLNGGTIGVWGKKSTPRGSGLASSEIKNLSLGTIAGEIAKTLMPKKSLLFEQFAYCADRNLMLPVAWANNIYDVCIGALRSKRKLARRKALLVQMNLIEAPSTFETF